MNINATTINKLIRAFSLFLIGLAFLYMKPDLLDDEMNLNYIVLLAAYIAFSSVICLIDFKFGFDLFEPITLVTFIFLMMFTVAPLYNILQNDLLHPAGVNTWGGCIMGTAIAFFSYLSFCVGYYVKFFQRKATYRKTEAFKKIDIKEKPKSGILVKLYSYCIAIWCIGFVFSVGYIGIKGLDFLYIFTVGIWGNVDRNLVGEYAYIEFLSVFSNLMIPAWMYIYATGKNRFVRWGLFYLMVASYVIRGFRVFLVILALAPIVFYYLKNKKRPSQKTIVLFIVVFIFVNGIVGFARSALRAGDEIALNDFGAKEVVEAVVGNLEVYKTYYGVIEAIPEQYPYTYGKQMIGYTAMIFIPRVIWADKPEPIIRDVLRVAINDYAVKGGSAFPNLGEYYMEFGLVGCIIFMFFLGKLCLFLKKIYIKNPESGHHLIAYSILLPVLFQIIIRGYTPTNFYLVLFMALPIYCLRKLIGDFKF